ncbi:glutamate racemase [Telmatospirillum sp.]|uniref:glutamate racemase n=1 Tax=Telmatospirillum sp. TaxID=2079197 RepID=UPI0028407DF5|nr:glutamate racemase [Telmatospirillum sp.]MDR3440148.1 glutamate racemase [Telmatospirillum sp.]
MRNGPFFVEGDALWANVTLRRHATDAEGAAPQPVVIYDSGVGGLSVATHLAGMCPSRDLVYLADNGWFPYGNKGEGALARRVHHLLDSLAACVEPAAILVACNTASTAITDRLVGDGSVPIIGVVPPIASAIAASRTGRVALLATPGTLSRRLVAELIRTHAESEQVTCLGPLALVDLAERKMAGESITPRHVIDAIERLLPRSGRDEIDVVILGCTHFPLLKDELAHAFPNARHWMDPAREACRATAARLSSSSTGDGGAGDGRRTLFLTSDHNDQHLREVFATRGFGRASAVSWETEAA